MKRGATAALKAVLVVIAIAAAAFLLFEPHVEGRNAHATLFEIYFKDPFLAYAYVGSIPFFLGLYHAYKLLTFAGRNNELSRPAADSARTIKRCAIALIAFVAGGEVFIMLSESDDRAGGVVMGAVIAFASILVAAGASALERALRNAAPTHSSTSS